MYFWLLWYTVCKVVMELRLLSNVRKVRNGLYYPHFFPFKSSSNSPKTINVGNINYTLFVFTMVLFIVLQAVLCAISQFQISVCTRSPAFITSCGERLICTRIIAVSLLAHWHLECQEQVLNTDFMSASFSAMSFLSYIWIPGHSSSLRCIPDHTATSQQHYAAPQILKDTRHLFTTFLISLLCLWNNLRLYMDNNILQQLSGHAFFFELPYWKK